jgi:ATP-dependent Lon protease
MPSTTKAKSIKHKELTIKELDYKVDFTIPKIKTSSDLSPCEGIIGQDSGINAIKLGLSVKSPGYNIFVTGHSGTGRTTTIRHLFKQLDYDHPELNDICYVNNFKNADSPCILTFKAGDGSRFKKDMGYLIDSIRKAVPKTFLSEDYKDRHSRVVREFENRQKKLIGEFEDKLSEAGFVMVQMQSGMGIRNEIQPLVDEQPTSLEQLEKLSKEGKFSPSKLEELGRLWDSLRRDFDSVTVESKKLADKLEDSLDKLDTSIVAPFISDKINVLKKRYPDNKIVSYLSDVEHSLTSDLDRFKEAQPRRGEEEPPPYRKREPFEEFSVNLILDNSDTEEIPIIIEKSPSYKNIFGSLERVVDRFGYWRTDFSRISSGSLLKASGGFFIINATDLLSEQGMWVQLKRALRNREIQIAGYDPFYMMAGAGIKPEPIPLDVKVVLIGEPEIYNLLWRLDEDFKKIFKVKAEFDSMMPLNKKNMRQYFEFVRRITSDENLLPFDLSGMQAVCEYGKIVSGRRDRLTTRFTSIADIVRESTFCANERKSKAVSRKDVHCAIKNKRSRINMIEDKIQEMYDNDILMVSTTGKAIGQINGLSVYNVGEFSFGRPTRITVNTALGKEGIINIERESDLSGPIHNKGVLVLSGYLRKMFAQDKPLAMSASISFEQSYSGVDGDSASSTEIYAILSSIGQIPIKQDIAVTGSVNQKGEIQPIGGVNQKIEGFYDVCNSKKLTGTQGVMIPHQNVRDLLLRPDVINAIKKKTFHIYPVKTIAEGMVILSDIKYGSKLKGNKFTKDSVLDIVNSKLHDMALTLQHFGRHDNNSAEKKNKK